MAVADRREALAVDVEIGEGSRCSPLFEEVHALNPLVNAGDGIASLKDGLGTEDVQRLAVARKTKRFHAHGTDAGRSDSQVFLMTGKVPHLHVAGLAAAGSEVAAA